MKNNLADQIVIDIKNNEKILANKIKDYVKSQKSKFNIIPQLIVESFYRYNGSMEVSFYVDWLEYEEHWDFLKKNIIPIMNFLYNDIDSDYDYLLFDIKKCKFLLTEKVLASDKLIIECFSANKDLFDFDLVFLNLIENLKNPLDEDIMEDCDYDGVYKELGFDKQAINKYLALI